MSGRSTVIAGEPAPERFGLEQRIVCQTSIEDLKWLHRTWPDENPTAKPPRSEILSDALIRARVEKSLRMEAALEGVYGIAITTPMLQAELDRMARNSKMPDRLREMFNALDNDPVAIAECIARPALVEKKLYNSYVWDNRQHGDLRAKAEAALRHAPDLEDLSASGGQAHRLALVRRDETPSQQTATKPDSLQVIELDNEAFTREVRRLTNQPGDNPAPRPVSGPALRETETAFIHEEVLNQTEDRLEVRSLVWKKRGFDSWWATQANQWAPVSPQALTDDLRLPAITGMAQAGDPEPLAGVTGDTWSVRYIVPSGRFFHTAVWTGSEMIVWGGDDGSSTFNTGGRYDPSTDTWTATTTTGAPVGRSSHTAVWTGSEMIVWGGYGSGGFMNTGSRYDPSTDIWTAMTTTGAPSGRDSHTAVWTGSGMIVWGGRNPGYLNTGGRYDPLADAWTATTTVGAPVGRHWHTSVWTGSKMIVWGGSDGSKLNTGGRYDPLADAWTATTTVGAPVGRHLHTSVWTGSEMITWGGNGSGGYLNTGGRYDPLADAWTATTTTGVPDRRSSHTVVWTGSEMIIWGGYGYDEDNLNTGGRYDPSTDTWTVMTTTGAPSGRYGHTAVWTGSVMIVWGGWNETHLNTGGRYDLSTDTWMATREAPSKRYSHTAVWTGSEMIVWGGTNGDIYMNTGGRYDPSTDAWTATTTAGAPSGRWEHTAVWTGREMIVWGGNGNTGGRYDPSTDAWTATTTTGAPSGRYRHTAVWTGSEMIVWGGSGQNTGGRYDPSTDAWTATTTTGAPSGRYYHTAVWTGREMIVWGGYASTGGRYDPSTDTWTATTTTGAPVGRENHTAVWTGSEMIVWGGYGWDYLNTGGRYDPSTDAWTATTTTGAPSGRRYHTSVWTGREMIVWGGDDNGWLFNTGGRYDPSTDTWMATATTGAPVGRENHTAVWTGKEMIVWGGYSASSLGIYYPYDQLFDDVSHLHWAYAWIETLGQSGIASGCDDNNYCPDDPVTRAQMAVFLERGVHGSSYVPPSAMGTVFDDVPETYWAAAWIEQLHADGITGGCDASHYCPEANMARGHAAVFLLRSEHGAAYVPPPATGMFDDVPATYWAAPWIEQLANEGITSGCGANNYCPAADVKRDQMAVFLVKTFNL
ncbi:Kelch repeat-containing protein [Thiolapillus brandeum]|nr:S-layer homology domain-containing protein [Thiolapillus brandeum]